MNKHQNKSTELTCLDCEFYRQRTAAKFQRLQLDDGLGDNRPFVGQETPLYFQLGLSACQERYLLSKIMIK